MAKRIYKCSGCGNCLENKKCISTHCYNLYCVNCFNCNYFCDDSCIELKYNIDATYCCYCKNKTTKNKINRP